MLLLSHEVDGFSSLFLFDLIENKLVIAVVEVVVVELVMAGGGKEGPSFIPRVEIEADEEEQEEGMKEEGDKKASTFKSPRLINKIGVTFIFLLFRFLEAV